jgi:hypothetical protein
MHTFCADCNINLAVVLWSMLAYSQTTGLWTLDSGSTLAIAPCLAGNNELGRNMNNPASQCIHNHGPLPRGVYTRSRLAFQPAVHSQGCALTPDPTNDMCGRSGFFLHLRNPEHISPDGTNASSDGCVTFNSFGDLVKFCDLEIMTFEVTA